MSEPLSPPMHKHGSKYPPNLYTIEWHLGGSAELPVLSKTYTNEPTARQILAHATESMRKWPGAIIRLRLWHRGALLASVNPNAFSGQVEPRADVPSAPNRGWSGDRAEAPGAGAKLPDAVVNSLGF